LLWRGSPHQLFQAINDDLVAFYTSRVLLDELEEVLSRRKFINAIRAANETLGSCSKPTAESGSSTQPKHCG
ncbi:MAG: hypothetical protein ACRET7_05020, partial [Burkholderiales bacterium]